VLARIVENWLTSAGEKGYQTAFSQLLAIEGFRVLQGPAHHAFEHGKDIIAYDSAGYLWAFQLKGIDVNLDELDSIQGQLLALAAAAVAYPGVEPPRRADRIALVTSGELTPPARNRLVEFNTAHRHIGAPIIELVERPQLVARFVEAHGQFLPSEPSDLARLLKFYVADGREPFPVGLLLDYLRESISPPRSRPTKREFSRAIGSALLLTAYASGPWERIENHLGVAQAYLALACEILRVASTEGLEEAAYAESYELALATARGRLNELLVEASAKQDFVIPDLVEGVVYSTRVLMVCGYLGAYYLAERELEDGAKIEESVRAVLLRELPYVRVVGEAGIGHVLVIGTALDLMGAQVEGRTLVAKYFGAVVMSNQEEGEAAPLPTPYTSLEEALKNAVGAELDEDPDEQFDGRAYTAHVAAEWLARRGERRTLEEFWKPLTRLTLCEFKPSIPSEYLGAKGDDDGTLTSWFATAPESWSDLSKRIVTMQEESLPGPLWRHLEFLPYIGLLLPYRMTTTMSRALDYLALGLVTVLPAPDAPALG
jgi:hypothetical protein